MTMDYAEGEGVVNSISNPEKNDMANNVETEMATSEPVKMNVEESIVVPEDEEMEEHTKEEQKVNEESTELEVMHEQISKEEVINEESTKEAVVNEQDPKEEGKDEEKVEVAFKKTVIKLRKRSRKKKMALGGTDDAVAKVTDKPEVASEGHTKDELINEKHSREVMNDKDAKEGEKNEEKVEAKLKEKVNKSRKRSRKKALKDSDVVASKDTDKRVVLNDEDAKEGVKNEEKVEVKSKEKHNKLRNRKRSRRKALRDTDEVVAKVTDEPESSEKKAKVKADIAGMIFMCSSKTKNDCYNYKILGLPASKRDIVLKINKGMKLFLFDFDLKLMYGIYKAARPGGYNIEPKAFNSAFPSQVRFKVEEDCLPLAEESFKKVIKDNYYKKNKFDCQLTYEQVKNLCKLFRVASKDQKSKPMGRSVRGETYNFVDRERTRRQPWEQERRHAIGGDHLNPEDHVVYGREAFVCSVAPPPLLPPLPPPSVPAHLPSYAYERSLELDAYRRGPLEHHDQRLLDLELRRRDEVELHDYYIPIRERLLHYDPLYSTAMSLQYHPPAGAPPEYHPPAARPPEYHPLRPLYRY